MFVIYILTLVLSTWVVASDRTMKTNPVRGNLSHSDKDMFVIHATVYEVGILSNKTDNGTTNSSKGKQDLNCKSLLDGNYTKIGEQESITFFNTNGSNVDLRAISSPVLTNVTAQSLVGVAPVNNDTKSQIESLDNWTQLAPMQNPTAVVTSGNEANSAHVSVPNPIRKRDLDHFIRTLFRRDLRAKSNDTVEVTKGSATIPSEVGVQSIGLPPLLSLNNNLSNIPVPIPNTSIVKYAKLNTLVQAP